jgi:hypothetical protein
LRAAAERVIVIPTISMRPEDFSQKLRAVVDAKCIRPPATDDDFRSAGERLGIMIPHDLRTCYRCVGGTDEATPLENGWIRFWPLEEWEKAAEFGRDVVLIADHGVESWWYGIDVDARGVSPIYIVDRMREPRIIADSFGTFAEAVFQDSRSIYAEPLASGAG